MKSAAITIAGNPSHPGLARLRNSCAAWGWKLFELHGPFVGWGNRLFRVAYEAKRLYEQEAIRYAVCVDSNDVVCCGPPDEIESAFEAYGQPPILCSVEAAPWPDGHVIDKFPPRVTNWWWPHSQWAVNLYKAIPGWFTDVGDYEDDQRHLTKIYLNQKDMPKPWDMQLDLRCGIVQSIAHSCPWESFFEFKDGRLRNKITGSRPLFIHANGQTDLSWFLPHLKGV